MQCSPMRPPEVQEVGRSSVQNSNSVSHIFLQVLGMEGLFSMERRSLRPQSADDVAPKATLSDIIMELAAICCAFLT